MLTRKTKLILMFAPLLLGFGAFGFLVHDLKHPIVERYPCEVLGRGLDVARYKTATNLLYANSPYLRYDIGFRCKTLGVVIVNDKPLPGQEVLAGTMAQLVHKTYQHLPPLWRLQVETGLKEEGTP